MPRWFTAVVAGFAAWVSATPASAALWNWSFNSGAETGSFMTNGTFADTAGPFNFVINVNSFIVTSSAFAATLTDDTFNEGVQPGNGFLWNGTTATQFYRAGGVFTNGSNLFANQDPYIYTIGIIGTPIVALRNSSSGATTGFQALTLTPVEVQQETSAPEPASLALLAVGLACLAVRRRA